MIAFAALFAGTLAGQELKNVQLLKGMTPTQIQRTMNFMRASLGVHCDFCHVVTEKTGWDFASDEKPQKKTGRDMIRLVMDANAKYFGGHQTVTCNTCHRGSTRPVGLPPLPQAQPPFPTPVTQKPALPTREEVVAKFAKALGNVDEQAFAAIEMKGVRESARGDAPMMIVVAPGNRFRVTSQTQEGEIINVIDGSSGWIRTPKETHAMSSSQIEHTSQLADAFRFILPRDISTGAKVTAKEKVGDHEAWVITAPWGTSGSQQFYFDTQSGLLLRRVTLMSSPIANVPQQTDYEDYRDVGGVKVPFVIRFDSVDPWIGATRRYSEIRLNARVDEAIFSMPK
jgi:outer membrane lipoprotein-sorting protein